MSISISEIAVVLVVALVVIKPEQLPDVAFKLGKWAKQLRGTLNTLRREIDGTVNHLNEEAPLKALPQKSAESKSDGAQHDAATTLKPEESVAKPNPTLLRFLIELRRRLLLSLVVITTLFCSLAYFSNSLYHWLALPLIKHLPQGSGLIATQVIAPLWIPFKFAMVVSVSLAIPFLIYQLWAFIAPALYHKERRLIWPLLFVSTALFYSGMAFAYFVIFPLLFSFLAHSAPENVMLVS